MAHPAPHPGGVGALTATRHERARALVTEARRRLLRWARPARDGALLALAIFVAGLASGLLPLGVDAHAYWSASLADPYAGVSLGKFGSYFYSPAFLEVLTPLRALPWPLFVSAWVAVCSLALVRMSGTALALALLFPPTFIELAMGNVHLLLALAIVAGFRWPGTWAFVLLTKVTPGVGLLWFAVRREWRSLAIALGATALVAAVSFWLSPAPWTQWLRLLDAEVRSGSPIQTGIRVPIALAPRLVLAVLVIVYAARTDRRWLVPVAGTIALPVLWINGFAMLIGAVPLAMNPRRVTSAEREARGSAPADPDRAALGVTRVGGV